MLHLTPRIRGFFVFGSALMLTATLIGQEPSKLRFKVVTFTELTKAADVKGEEKRKPELDVGALEGVARAALLESLNRLGKSNWEAIAEGERGIVFRASPQAWEYRLVRAPESTLNGKSDDDEVLQLLLDRLSTDGWDLCSARAFEGKNLILKRMSNRWNRDESKKTDDFKKAELPSPPSIERKKKE